MFPPPLKEGNSKPDYGDSDYVDSDSNETVKVNDKPTNDPISSRLRRSNRAVAEEVSVIEDRAEQLANFKRRKWHHCIINQCSEPLGDLADWQKHIKTHHQDSSEDTLLGIQFLSLTRM